MYEAIPSSTSLANTASEDPEMAKFLPMLNDYLRRELKPDAITVYIPKSSPSQW